MGRRRTPGRARVAPPAAGAPRAAATTRIVLACAIAGVVLRVLLCWVNPTQNVFDNHYEPILWIMQHGSLPPKDALWQAYQPPVFYVVSAAFGSMVQGMGASPAVTLKALQLLSCAFDVALLGMVGLILVRLPLSPWARLVAFAIACFLPRDLYQAALHSNDPLAALAVATAAWLMLVARDRGFPFRLSLLLGAALSVTLFTKYTAFVVLPMALALMLPPWPRPPAETPARRRVALALVVALPLVVMGAFLAHNQRTHGTLLPWNTALLDPSRTQPRASSPMGFVSFAPWTFVAAPILTPRNLDSFWTMLHASAWFDTEPKFLYFLDRRGDWWNAYYAWLRGEAAFPGDPPLPPLTRALGAALIGLGVVPLALALLGLARWARALLGRAAFAAGAPDLAGLTVLAALFVANLAGIAYLTLRSPVYSSVKATYVLGALPAFAALAGWGAMALERHAAARRAITVVVAALCALATLHVLSIVAARGFAPGA
jgi:hypothetical protein